MLTSIMGFFRRISSVNMNNKDTKAGQIVVILVDQSLDSFAISCLQRNSPLTFGYSTGAAPSRFKGDLVVQVNIFRKN